MGSPLSRTLSRPMEEKKIILELTPKQAMAIDMMYTLGTWLLTKDRRLRTILPIYDAMLTMKFSRAEKQDVARKMNELSDQIPPEVLEAMGARRVEDKTAAVNTDPQFNS